MAHVFSWDFASGIISTGRQIVRRRGRNSTRYAPRSSPPSPRSDSSSTTSSCSAGPRPARCASPSTAGGHRSRRDHRRHAGGLADPRRRRADRGAFLLEVSSPGVERALRRPAHYAGARRRGLDQVPHRGGAAPRARHARRRRRRALPSSRSKTANAKHVAFADDHAGAHRVRVGSATASRTNAKQGRRPARAKERA